ncbi:MAG: adenylate/guanylate cyclase domain-containing protein [Candidatus Omnitrophica bacterium]|nr:adenylate/guanylate cyclase domain-containing protein [Candidatus Omnitrophota bacterium]
MTPITLAHKKKIQVYSILIMTCIAVAVAICSFVYLYMKELDDTRVTLEELVKSQARIYEAVAKFDAIVSGTQGGQFSRAATMSQIKEAHIHYTGFGETGELVLAERVGDEIVFLLPPRKMDFEVPPSVPWSSDLAGPMKLALSGKAGTVTAKDHHGDRVLAAYEYLPFLEMGLVAKKNLSEIREPFVHAALFTSIVAWLAILLGSGLNFRIVGPLIGAVFEANKRLEEDEKRLDNLSKQLAKYLSPPIYQSIFEGKKVARIECHRKKLTIFFSDIVGFTETTNSMEPEDLSYFLNGYLNRMAEIVIKHGGTLDKFIGDAVLVFFGDPETQGAQKDAIRCVSMAIEMQKAIQEMIAEWQLQGIAKRLSARMGVTTGYCTVGNFGSEDRMEYTIVGNSVNLASRLETNSKPGEILISQETATLVDGVFELEEVEAIQAKGFAHPVRAFRVLGPKSAEAAEPGIIDTTTGLSLKIDLDALSPEEREALVRKLNETISLFQKEDGKKS